MDGTEEEFLRANLCVFSNAKNHRKDPLVPLVVPTVNISQSVNNTQPSSATTQLTLVLIV